jgi:uncharacterized protein
MKQTFSFTMLVTIMFLAISPMLPARAQENDPHLFRLQSLAPDTRTISTTGAADVHVVPNKITVVLGAKHFDKSLQAACAAVDQAVARIMQLAIKTGIEKSDIQTADITITPIYEESHSQYGASYGSTPVSRPVGYSAQQSIGLVLRKGQGAGALIKEALAAGANTVDSIVRETTELRKYRDQTRLQALQAAREKAVALAGECGMKVGRPLHIQEGSYASTQTSMSQSQAFQSASNLSNTSSVEAEGRSESPSDSLAVGRIPVGATVSVVWQLSD